MDLDTVDTLCFQLGGVRRRMTWRKFILALGLHTEHEMAEAGFKAYWAGSERLILNKGDLRDYYVEISSERDLLGPTPSYVYIRDPVVTHELPLINLHELGRLNIYTRYGDTWAWVAPGPERQQAAATGAHEGDESGPAVEEPA
nr:hypothetical protein [Tanacetum cinerariifolium]